MKKNLIEIKNAAHLFSARLFAAFIFLSAVPVTAYAAPAVENAANVFAAADEKTAASLSAENETAANNGSDAAFVLRSITFDAENFSPDTHELTKIAEKILNRRITGKTLDAALNEMTFCVRAQGRPAAFAYVPTQTAKDGALVVKINPGRFGAIVVENESGIAEKLVNDFAARLKSGEIIRSENLEAALYAIDDIYGVRAHGILRAGDAAGTSDFVIRAQKETGGDALIYTENYGNKASGRYRMGLRENIALKRLGGKITFGALASNGDMRNFFVGAAIPAAHGKVEVGLNFSRADYELGSLFENLGWKGKADTLDAYAKFPLRRTAKTSLTLKSGIMFRGLTDTLSPADISIKKRSRAVYFGVDGARNGKNCSFDYSLSAGTGKISARSDWAKSIGEVGRTLGRYEKIAADIRFVQRLGKHYDAILRAEGQKAGRNLDSSEKFYLGGARGVRAYPQGEATGDEGMIFTAELRRKLGKNFTASIYFDIGHARFVKDDDDGATLKGWGASVAFAQAGDCFFRVDLAKRIGGRPNFATAKHRLWFLAGKLF